MEHATPILSQQAGVRMHVMEPSGTQSSKKSYVRAWFNSIQSSRVIFERPTDPATRTVQLDAETTQLQPLKAASRRRATVGNVCYSQREASSARVASRRPRATTLHSPNEHDQDSRDSAILWTWQQTNSTPNNIEF